MTKYTYWQIWVDNMWEDTVGFDSGIPANEVRRSLIDHDGYPENIIIKLDDETRG
tara:strand:+ start:48 stop:212 length:165 start_codon:yes stop_codon:yes gene_type:complete